MHFFSRIQREAKTVNTMIHRYCHDMHGSSGNLCPECSELAQYALNRLERCPFQEGKTTCGKCSVHCYRPEMRDKIKEVMRYVGPRMILTNPLLALAHLLDGKKKIPTKHKPPSP